MKTILIVCKEGYTYPMNFIKDELQRRGYEVEALFIHSSECLFRDKSLTDFENRNNDIKIHTIEDIAIDYKNKYKNADNFVDLDYLKGIEEKYCVNLPFNLMLMCSQLFTTQYHYRFYFRDLTENEKMLWVQLLFKKLEKTIEEVQPTAIFDLDIAEIGRTILHQISQVNNIPYKALEFSRYKSICLPTQTLGRYTDKYFRDEYYKEIANASIDEKYLAEVNDFRNSKNVMAKDYSYNNTSKKDVNTLFTDVKRLFNMEKRLLKEWIKNFNHTGFYSEPPIVANYPKALTFFVYWIIRERFLFSKLNKLFTSPVEGEKYVYFPLHLIPESTTLNKSPFFPNELSVIEAISKSLPVGWKLYIKEHGNMIGERPLSFYRHILRLSNTRIMKLNYYNDPKPWIEKSMGVITLSGTAAFEAAMLGKKSIMFGNTYFELLDGISKIDSFSDLPRLIEDFKTPLDDNTKSLATYIKLIRRYGKKIGIGQLLKESNDEIQKSIKMSDSSYLYVKNIVDIFETDIGSL
jgi:hypothetical protein